MYCVELAYHIELLKYLVIDIEINYIFLALIPRFTLIDPYFKKIYLFLKYILTWARAQFWLMY